MGYKHPVTIVQSTRFKRKLASSTSSTPPATPFNNTSFLIRLQQLREQYNPKRLRFDQYGSMEHVINSCFATPQNHLHSNNICSPKSPNERKYTFHSDCPELSSCSDRASSSAKTEKDPRMPERDGVCHHQHLMDDNSDIHSRKGSRDLDPPI